jgi:hypothetical protein
MPSISTTDINAIYAMYIILEECYYFIHSDTGKMALQRATNALLRFSWPSPILGSFRAMTSRYHSVRGKGSTEGSLALNIILLLPIGSVSDLFRPPFPSHPHFFPRRASHHNSVTTPEKMNSVTESVRRLNEAMRKLNGHSEWLSCRFSISKVR